MENSGGCFGSERKKAPRNSVRVEGWLAKGGTQPVVKMDGLSPYKSNGIFDRRWAGECRPQSGDEREGNGGWVSATERVREGETERETEQVRGVLQDGGYKGWFRAREGCG